MKWEVECKTNVDHYCNISRRWSATDGVYRLTIWSGSDSIQIDGNGHVGGGAVIPIEIAEAAAAELVKAAEFTREAQTTARQYWEAKNENYGMLQKLRSKYNE